MPINLELDPGVLREQMSLLRGFLANPKLTGRQRFLVTDLLRLLNQLDAATGAPAPGPTPAPVRPIRDFATDFATVAAEATHTSAAAADRPGPRRAVGT